MMSAHEVIAKDEQRKRLAEQMAAYEAKHGPVVTSPASQYDKNGMQPNSDARNGWENRGAKP
jgi:hypothetical protein